MCAHLILYQNRTGSPRRFDDDFSSASEQLIANGEGSGFGYGSCPGTGNDFSGDYGCGFEGLPCGRGVNSGAGRSTSNGNGYGSGISQGFGNNKGQ